MTWTLHDTAKDAFANSMGALLNGGTLDLTDADNNVLVSFPVGSSSGATDDHMAAIDLGGTAPNVDTATGNALASAGTGTAIAKAFIRVGGVDLFGSLSVGTSGPVNVALTTALVQEGGEVNILSARISFGAKQPI